MSLLIEQQREFTNVVGQFIHFAYDNHYWLRMGDAYRSPEALPCPNGGMPHSYQDQLMLARRTKTKSTRHADRCAVDFIVERVDGVPMGDEDWYKLGSFWEDHGGRWGGRFGVDRELWYVKLGWDPGHFEWPHV